MLLLIGCTMVQGSGVPASEVRDIDEITELRSTSLVDIDYVVADETHAELFCDDNLLDNVVTEVDGERLVIRTVPNNAVLRPETACYLELEAPCLTAITLTGSGDLHSDDVMCELEELRLTGSGDAWLGGVEGAVLDLEVTGSGDASLGALDLHRFQATLTGSGSVDAWGHCGHADITLSGSGDLRARDLLCRTADIHSTGSGDVELSVSGLAVVHVHGSGDVDLWGGPYLDIQETGTGGIVLH